MTRQLPPIPLVTTRVVDITNPWFFPEFAIAAAYSRGETPSPDLIARADARLARSNNGGEGS